MPIEHQRRMRSGAHPRERLVADGSVHASPSRRDYSQQVPAELRMIDEEWGKVLFFVRVFIGRYGLLR
jgi:hypothetical protein